MWQIALIWMLATLKSEQTPDIRPEVVVQAGQLSPHQGVFSPDGALFAIYGDEPVVRIWDVSSGRMLRIITLRNPVYRVVFSPAATHEVVIITQNRRAELWDVGTGVVRSLLYQPPDPTDRRDNRIPVVAFHPSGRELALWPADNGPTQNGTSGFRIWDALQGKVLRDIPGANSYQPDLLQFNDQVKDRGRYLLATVGSSIQAYDTVTGVATVRYDPQQGGPEARYGEDCSVCYSDRFIALGTRGSEAAKTGSGCIWSLFGRSYVRNVSGLPIGFLSEEEIVMIDRTDALAVVEGVQSGVVRWRLPRSADSLGATCWLPSHLTPDMTNRPARPVVAEWLKDGTVRLYEIPARDSPEQGCIVAKSFVGYSSIQRLLGWSPERKAFIVQHLDGTLRYWDRYAGLSAAPRTLQGALQELSPDQQWLASAGGELGGTIHLLNLKTNRTRTLPPHPGIGGIYALAFSRDGRLLAAATKDARVQVWDTRTGRVVRRAMGDGLRQNDSGASDRVEQMSWAPYQALAFSPDGHHVLSYGKFPSSMVFWDIRTGGDDMVRFPTFDEDERKKIYFSPDGTRLLMTSPKRAAILDPRATKVRYELEGYEANAGEGAVNVRISFSADGKYILGGSGMSGLKLWDASNGRLIKTFTGHQGIVEAAYFSPDGKSIYSSASDRTVKCWDLQSGKETASYVIMDNQDYIITLPEGYYISSWGGLHGIAFRSGQRAYRFEQFDLLYNRPDIVLERLGSSDHELIEAYRKVHAKRLAQMGITEQSLQSAQNRPSVEVAAVTLPHPDAQEATIHAVLSSLTPLGNLHVVVNGVPLYGVRGKPISSDNREVLNAVAIDVNVPLSAGRSNSIQIWVTNSEKVPSLEETAEVICRAPRPRPKLYVVAVGVSQYADQSLNLLSADKDPRDIAAYFKELEGDAFEKVLVYQGKPILNREATRETILGAKAFLQQAGIEDHVIVFLSGHGQRDANLNYYFATYDNDFRKPEARGLSEADLEELLDDIPSRQKLLLLDSCYAGDPDQIIPIPMGTTGKGKGTFNSGSNKGGIRRQKGITEENVNSVAARLKRLSLIDRVDSTFVDLRKGSGAVVIAASSGSAPAYEKDQNGYFTQALLDGLRNYRAAKNRASGIKVSELRNFVVEQVKRITNQSQKPNIRHEIYDNDFPVQPGSTK